MKRLELDGSKADALTRYTVSINPEAERHIRVEDKVEDSTTANVAVLIHQTVGELNKDNTRNRVDFDGTDSVRRTVSDGKEHVVKS